MIKVLAFAGSTREDSYNKKLLKIAADCARSAGASVTLIDLHDYSLPIYDGDLEDHEGIPRNALRLKKLFLDHEAFLLSLPEYNASLSGVFKNVIDWVSRKNEDEKVLECFDGKIIGLLSASPGNLGGLRGLTQARLMLESITAIVMPEQFCLVNAHMAFDEYGNLKDEKHYKSVSHLSENLINLTSRFRGFHVN